MLFVMTSFNISNKSRTKCKYKIGFKSCERDKNLRKRSCWMNG